MPFWGGKRDTIELASVSCAFFYRFCMHRVGRHEYEVSLHFFSCVAPSRSR